MIINSLEQFYDAENITFFSLKLSDRRRLPNCNAVYFLIDDDTEECLYVGQAGSKSGGLVLRWQNHDLLKLRTEYPNLRIAWLACPDPSCLNEIESFYIKELEPPYNKRGTALSKEDFISKFLCLTIPLIPTNSRTTIKLLKFFASKFCISNVLTKTVAEIMKETGFSKPTIIETLKALERHNIIRRKTGVIFLSPDIVFKGKTSKRRALMIEYLQLTKNGDDL